MFSQESGNEIGLGIPNERLSMDGLRLHQITALYSTNNCHYCYNACLGSSA